MASAYNNVFKRVEKKYRINADQRFAIEKSASEVMAVDAYGKTRVTSLYLDTPERSMIARSVEKPLYKEKLRIRAYGSQEGALLMAAFRAGAVERREGSAPLSDSEIEARCKAGDGCGVNPLTMAVFFGIKKKFKGIVYKRRLALSLPAALGFASGLSYEQAVRRWPMACESLAQESLSTQTRQIARELDAAMNRHLPLVASMGIACDRVAWALPQDWQPADVCDATDPGFRITFDNALEYFDCMAQKARWSPIIDPCESIMEVKSAGPYPSWLVSTLSAQGVYPASFTKYGNAYQLCA